MIPRRLSLTGVTGAEPITLIDAKDHLRVDLSDDDGLISSLLSAARQYFEEETGRQLVLASYELVLDRFPASRHTPIELPRPPLSSVTSIVYLDADGVEQTWSASEYTVQAYGGPSARPGRVYPGADYAWPATQSVPGAVTITYEAGYADGAVPDAFRATLLTLIADLYAHREAQVTGTIVSENKTVRRLMNRWRLPVMA